MKPDVVHADHTCMAFYAHIAHTLFNIPMGLRLHNVESVIWQRYSERFAAWHPKRWLLTHQAQLLHNYEMQECTSMNVCFPITDIDKQRVETAAPVSNCLTVSAGVDIQEWNIDTTVFQKRQVSKEIILATTYTWVHNVEAVLWLTDEIIPRVQQYIPDIRLTLLGGNPPKELQQRESSAVHVAGFVDSIRPFMERSAVYVAPLFVGGGIRIKILEAMAMALPVVATTISGEGIKAQPENGLFLHDIADAFAERIVRLLQHPDETLVIGKQAQKFIQEHHTWSVCIGKMLTEYQRLIQD
jgi:glycosyltransferase involved in cell wall biosynthesis